MKYEKKSDWQVTVLAVCTVAATNGGKSSPTAEQLAAQSDKYKQVLDIYSASCRANSSMACACGA